MSGTVTSWDAGRGWRDPPANRIHLVAPSPLSTSRAPSGTTGRTSSPLGSSRIKPVPGLPAPGSRRTAPGSEKYSGAVMTMKRPTSVCMDSVARSSSGGPSRRKTWKCSRLSPRATAE
eukprot:358843-Chlamydomonas_euryale.AAC.6